MISIIIPTKNNEGDIKGMIERVHEAMHEKYEIILIDDNSSDSTVEEAVSLGLNRPIRVICWKHENGLARAQQRGIRDARGEIIVMLLDITLASSAIEEITDAVRKGGDIVGFIAGEPQGLLEKAASWLAGTPYVWSPAFAFSRRSIEGIRLRGSFYHKLLEILVKSGARNRRITVRKTDRPSPGRRGLTGDILRLFPWAFRSSSKR